MREATCRRSMTLVKTSREDARLPMNTRPRFHSMSTEYQNVQRENHLAVQQVKILRRMK